MTNDTVDSEFITKETFDTLQKEVKALGKAQAKQRDPAIHSTSISKGDLRGLQTEVIMFVVGVAIAFGVNGVNQRIDDLKEDISANKVAIAENKVMIQKVLDKLDELEKSIKR